MKVSLTQDNLAKALNAVGRIVGSRASLPVLANVLIQTEDNRLKLATTNLEVGITHWVGAKVEKTGAITVPARLLAEYVSNLPAQTIHLEVEKQNLHLTSERYESHINGIDAEEFPTIPSITTKPTVSLPAAELRQALSQVVLVASNDDARPVLNGVFFYNEADKLVLAATDSYRLAEKQLKLKTKPANNFKVIVPARTINELLRMIDEAGETVELSIDENQVLFKAGDVEIVSRLIDGQFPDYRQLIPKDSLATATLPTTEFTQIAKVASLFARESASSVTLSVDATNKSVSLKSIAAQVGDNVSTANAAVEGETTEVTLNCRYILDALSVVGSNEVSFVVTGKVNPCLVRPQDEPDYLHIIMPLRS